MFVQKKRNKQKQVQTTILAVRRAELFTLPQCALSVKAAMRRILAAAQRWADDSTRIPKKQNKTRGQSSFLSLDELFVWYQRNLGNESACTEKSFTWSGNPRCFRRMRRRRAPVSESPIQCWAPSQSLWTQADDEWLARGWKNRERQMDGAFSVWARCCSKTMGRCSLVRWFGHFSSVSGFDIQLMEAIKIISYPNSQPLLTVMTELNQNTALKELTHFSPDRNWWERSRHTLNPAFLVPCSVMLLPILPWIDMQWGERWSFQTHTVTCKLQLQPAASAGWIMYMCLRMTMKRICA